jgi:hypothetical protein
MNVVQLDIASSVATSGPAGAFAPRCMVYVRVDGVMFVSVAVRFGGGGEQLGPMTVATIVP